MQYLTFLTYYKYSEHYYLLLLLLHAVYFFPLFHSGSNALVTVLK